MITEHAHLRMLRVLLELFYQPLLIEGFFGEEDLANIFPSLEELIDEHSENWGGGRELGDDKRVMGQNGSSDIMGIIRP